MQGIKIIAEIGINHNGEAEHAFALINAAAEAGVWGIKFQYRNLDNAYADQANQIGDEMLISEIKRNYLSPEVILQLTEKSKKRGLNTGISFFDARDMGDFGEHLAEFDFFKSPSVELSNNTLINRMLQQGKPVFISLGCHNEHEIENAFTAFDGDNWTALHCVSNYPVSLANARLGYIKHLATRWNRPFGYSSHDDNWEVTLIAMSMGASVIERHITFDKHARGLDHTTSSTPEEFAKMVMFAEHMPLVMAGDGPRVVNQGELLNLQNLGRSYYVTKAIQEGETVTENDVTLSSPRVGFGQNDINEFINKKAVRGIEAGQVLSRSAFVKSERIADNVINFSRQNKLAIPVRLHDLADIEKKFPVGSYEFHLSFGEVLSELDAGRYSPKHTYSIHLPDYISPTQLMDPFSGDVNQAELSQNILQRTVNFADDLQQLTGKQVPIVGSFSVVHKGLDQFYQQYASLLAGFRHHGVEIMPQWLPPIAWYFGGSVTLNVMNQPEDIDQIIQHQIPVCMDVCHLCMGDSVFDFNAGAVINTLGGLIKHVHIADAAGIDGEGLHFGEGDPKNLPAIEASMRFDCMKVIEVWQGHLDDGAGFAKALHTLTDMYDGKI